MLHADGSTVRMSGVHRTFLVLVAVLAAIPGWKLLATLPANGVMMEQIVPAEARPGDIVTVTGYALDRNHIQEMYLVDEDNNTYGVEILSASGRSLRFRVPGKVPAGWMGIVVRAPGKAALIDQMIYLKILDPLG